jgi:hypothetical protein
MQTSLVVDKTAAARERRVLAQRDCGNIAEHRHRR